jgi:hypothetical protein
VFPPVVELAGRDVEPLDEAPGADLGPLQPAPDEIHDPAPRIKGNQAPVRVLQAFWGGDMLHHQLSHDLVFRLALLQVGDPLLVG